MKVGYLLGGLLLFTNAAWVYYALNNGVTLDHQATELGHQRQSVQLLSAILSEAHQLHGPDAFKQWVKANYPDAMVKENGENLEIQDFRFHFRGDTLDRVEPL
jgi:hypothetical protein